MGHGRGFAVRRWKVPRRDGACFWKLCFYSSSGPSSFSASVPSSYSDASHTSSPPYLMLRDRHQGEDLGGRLRQRDNMGPHRPARWSTFLEVLILNPFD